MILQRVSGDLNFSNPHENWVLVCTFFHPINVTSQNTIIHINLLELLQALSSSFAGLLCALPAPWCAFCLRGKQFTVVTFITKCHREARGAVLLSSPGRVGLVFQNGLVSPETCNVQHQASVTQTSLWPLDEHFFLKTLFSWKSCPADKQPRTAPISPHLVTPWFCQFGGTLAFMPTSFHVLRSANAFYRQHFTLLLQLPLGQRWAPRSYPPASTAIYQASARPLTFFEITFSKEKKKRKCPEYVMRSQRLPT